MKAASKKTLLLTLLIGTSFTAGVYASDGIEKVEAYLRSDFKVVLNGTSVSFATPPLIYDSRTYLPLKELASIMDANVNWDDKNKTIFINKRLPQQTVKGMENEVYEEVTIQNPGTYEVTYLGGKYSLFTMSSGYSQYYRARDLIEMGVDIGGLKKAREKYSGMIFIEENEAKKALKEPPKMVMTGIPAIGGTTDEKLKKELKDLATERLSYLLGANGQRKYVRIFLVDAVPNKPDYFYMLGYEGGLNGDQIRMYIFEMKRNSDGTWYRVTYQTGQFTDFAKFMDKVD